ncbi:MAG: universal stress protein [Chloroflexi bacterium]|nr:universal stress protein [Chloroflexota bacterium]
MRILLATDGSPRAQVALELLLALPLRPTDHVTVLAVPVHSYAGVGMEGTGVYFAEICEEETNAARRVAQEAWEVISAKGLAATARVQEGPAPRTIIEIARAEGVGLIVMGSRGRGFVAGALLGSTARAVARHSPIPVLVARERRHVPVRILIATDGSEDAQMAIRTFAALPLPPALEVTLLNVLPERSLGLANTAMADELRALVERRDREEALEILSRAHAMVPSGASTRMELEHGGVTDRIIETAKAMGADLIVIGARGARLRGDEFLQGSTADRLIETAHCAVLVARTPERAKPTRAERETVGATAR